MGNDSPIIALIFDMTLRQPMAENINPRTKRARDALMKAAFGLVSERPVAEISLTEVAETAGVSRPTVYKQFNDTASLVAETVIARLDQALTGIDARIGDSEDEEDYFQQLMASFVDAVYADRNFYHNAVYGPSAAQIMTGVSKMLDERMSTHRIGRRLASSGANADDYRAAISAGVVWLLVRWLGTDFTGDNTPERIAERIASTLFALSRP